MCGLIEPVSSRPCRSKVDTRSRRSHRTPAHWQIGEVLFHEERVLVGSLVIIDLNESKACLSLRLSKEEHVVKRREANARVVSSESVEEKHIVI